jgi:hypothetical protein
MSVPAQPAAAATPLVVVPVQASSAVAAPSVPAPVAPVLRGGGALASGESDYVLVVGDVVELNVFREPDLTTQATLARYGTVQLPLIREVKLAGLTIRDAREVLRGLYDKQFLVDPQVFLQFGHRKIHFAFHQAKSQGLISHQSLVVAFGIGYCFFVVAPVGEHTPQFAHTPFIVGFFFQQLDPMIRNAHAKSVIETNTTIRCFPA